MRFVLFLLAALRALSELLLQGLLATSQGQRTRGSAVAIEPSTLTAIPDDPIIKVNDEFTSCWAS